MLPPLVLPGLAIPMGVLIPTLHRPDPHWCRLQSLVSDDLPAHGLPPPNSFWATVRNLVWDPTPQGWLHSDQSLNSVHSQSACSGSFLFLRGIFRITNRLSLVSDSAESLNLNGLSLILNDGSLILNGGSLILTGGALAALSKPDSRERSGAGLR